MSNAFDNLPPEMQARLAQILEGSKQQPDQPAPPPVTQQPPAPPTPPVNPAPAPPPVVKPPSLLDHIIAIRQENQLMKEAVVAMSSQLIANSQTVQGVGYAVGRLYSMFQPSEQQNQDSTYSQNFQQSQMTEEDGDY